MEKINMLYIDDSPEGALERYLEKYERKDYEIEYSEIIFKPNDGYESLIKSPVVQASNIIFIDSRLFENRNAADGKFTGEEFKIILKKYYPFIEVIVISQNEIDSDLETISKYNPQSGKTASEYYAETLPRYIEQAIRNIQEYRRIAVIMESNTSWESVLKEKIFNSLQGIGTYDELSKEDIDQLIEAFKEIQEKLDV